MKVLIATPTVDGKVSVEYHMGLNESCLKHGDVHDIVSTFVGFTLVDRARDKLASIALEQERNILFIDADIGFDHRVFRKLLDTAEAYPTVGVMGVPYPRRAYVKGEENQEIYSVAAIEGPEGEPDENGVCNVNALPTGFMLIKHEVLAAMAPKLEAYMQGDFVCRRFFPSILLGPSDRPKQLYSEDFSFCILAKQMGVRIAALTGMPITHHGSHEYSGAWRRNSLSAW